MSDPAQPERVTRSFVVEYDVCDYYSMHPTTIRHATIQLAVTDAAERLELCRSGDSVLVTRIEREV